MKDWESSTVLLRGVKDVFWSDFGVFWTIQLYSIDGRLGKYFSNVYEVKWNLCHAQIRLLKELRLQISRGDFVTNRIEDVDVNLASKTSFQ